MNTAEFRAPLRRFVWKEYRTLRGLWLAVLVVALGVNWLCGLLMSSATDWSTLRFSIALAAATLYAAGAASVLFSLEHEEQTFDFLRTMPATWRPAFAGKVLLAASSSLGLAIVLAITGFVISGLHTNAGNLGIAAGVLGVAILEALAWGTLCSILIPRPMVAAIATLVITALAIHLEVIAVGASASASTSLESYVAAIPLRLLVVALVLCASVFAARSWLTPDPKSLSASPQTFGWFSAGKQVVARFVGRSATRAGRSRSRTSMIARLVWQSWRESWKLLLLPVLVAACCIGLVVLLRVLQIGATNGGEIAALVALATMFFGPALYGALAFAADQRRGSVRFLSEHAAAPRYVWLSRHIVWLGTLIAVAAILALACGTLFFHAWHDRTSGNAIRPWSYYQQPAFYVVQDLLRGAEIAATIVSLGGFGLLAAYSIGQFCSLLLRSDVLAAFLALFLSVALSAWVVVLFLWELSSWLFLLPLAAGLLGATWLRAPSWVAGRNDWRAWIKPAIAIGAALLLIWIALPTERLAQVRFAPGRLPAASVTAAEQLEAAATAEMYLKAAAILAAPISDSEVDLWFGPNAPPGPVPEEKKEEHAAAQKKYFKLLAKQSNEAVNLAVATSQRPNCQFSFNLDVDSRRSSRGFYRLQLNPGKTYEDVDRLLTAVIFEFDESGHSAVSAPIDRLLAGLRMSAHIRSGQPAQIFIHQLEIERQILGWISGWAAAKDRTNDERRKVLAKLQEFFGSHDESQAVPLMNAFYAEQRLIEQVIAGKKLPLILSQDSPRSGAYLAYLANELPWERERASMALQLITDQNISISRDLANYLKAAAPGYHNNNLLWHWLEPSRGQPAWMTYQPQATTSYLVAFEYNARVPVGELFRAYCDTITWRRATVFKIALAMYRQEQGKYPASLSELVPEYLDEEPLDPYSGQPFVYHPRGLELPLRRYYYASAGIIQPHTPVFWSVGPNDDRLQFMLMNDAGPNTPSGTEDVSDPIDPSATDSKPQYVLYNEGASYVYDTTELIFQLPK